MSKIGSTYVPDEGPENAKILCVGEAPGEDEESEGCPFIGKSGQFLERYLGRAGLSREQVFLANLCHYRPAGNKFELLLGSDKLDEGLNELGETINRINPNIIIALGRWPMYYLTGSTAEKGKAGTGITSWRGSIVPAIDNHIPNIAGRKVGITYHPAFVIRPEGFSNHPLFHFDLVRFAEESITPILNHPIYDSLINPPNVWDVVAEMKKAEWLSIDIETFGDTMACVGFADGPSRGLCITFENHNGWEPAWELLQSDVPKIFQYGIFDVDYIHNYYDVTTKNYIFDTYIAAANLEPEFPKGLDFLTSVYTPFPFYKEERKIWKRTGELTTYWNYNIKDCIVTYIIAMQQMRQLEALYKEPFNISEMLKRAI